MFEQISTLSIPIRDGGSAAYRINRCPWCGAVV